MCLVLSLVGILRKDKMSPIEDWAIQSKIPKIKFIAIIASVSNRAWLHH